MNSLHILAESESDAIIIRTILDCSQYTHVYSRSAFGKEHMASVCRSLRLMLDTSDCILVVFDSDKHSETERIFEEQRMIRETRADVSCVKIGVFAYLPTIEQELFNGNVSSKVINDNLKTYLKSHIEEIRSFAIVKRIQDFVCKA